MTTRLKISDWRPEDRPRERLLAAQHAELSDAEILAVLMRTGQGDCNAIDLGCRLLADYGSFRDLLDAPAAELLARPGLGPARVASLKAVLPIAGRYAACRLKERQTLVGSQDAAMFITAKYAGLEREVFSCIFLDARNRMIHFEKMFYGSVDRANVFPREIAKAALDCNAASIIFAHNHPSGVADPSPTDVELTNELTNILKELDIKVLDHLIVGNDRTVSMAERGLV